MQTYQIITRCGVTFPVNALNQFQACQMAREQGWQVLYICPLITK